MPSHSSVSLWLTVECPENNRGYASVSEAQPLIQIAIFR